MIGIMAAIDVQSLGSGIGMGLEQMNKIKSLNRAKSRTVLGLELGITG